jgi:hypothetical protein
MCTDSEFFPNWYKNWEDGPACKADETKNKIFFWGGEDPHVSLIKNLKENKAPLFFSTPTHQATTAGHASPPAMTSPDRAWASSSSSAASRASVVIAPPCSLACPPPSFVFASELHRSSLVAVAELGGPAGPWPPLRNCKTWRKFYLSLS